MRRITSTDLENWAPTRDCQEHLPLLVRKLIRASPVTVLKMLFPAGDNVILPGCDGTLEVVEGTEYIPLGKSVWEVGSGKEFKEKAERDYKTRTGKAGNEELTETVFVFVTPRVWSGKEEWTKEKQEKKEWKNVQVIDGQVLEEWIELLPSVSAWLAKFLQIPFGNIQPLEEFWQEWSENLQHSIPSTLVVTGREKETKKLTEFLAASPNLITIKASTIEEAIAFIAASVEKMDADYKEEIYARTIIIENEQDFRSLVSIKNPLILIARFEGAGIIDQAVRNGLHVILPINNDITAANEASIELPRIRRNGLEKGLEEMGFDFDKIQQLIRDSGQSLSVLRRLLKFERNRQPAWAKDGHHSDIIPALLAGMWSEQKEEDKSLINLLAGEPYEKYISKLSRWRIEKDAPIIQVGSLWKVTSALDSWSILAPFLLKSDLDNFKTSFLAVAQETNPAMELEADQRYLASIYGKTTKFSNSLKEGLCQSLVLIAIFGEQFGLKAIDSLQNFADGIVRDLLHEADSQKWCTLASVLPLLAEASPNSFLSAVEFSLRKDDPAIMAMFGGSDNLFTSTSYHTGLLWALENLVFSSEYLLRATLILAHLSRLDPGGKLRNRPINSLKEIFNPWYSQVDADFKARQNVLSKLLQKEPDIAWELFLGIAPQSHIIVHPIHKCRWRFDFQHLERSVTYQQGWDFDSFLFDKLLLLGEGNEERIATLISFYPKINIKEREKLLQFLRAHRNTVHDTNTIVWDKLRKLLSKHRGNSKQSWALPGEELDKVEEIFNLYMPLDTKKKYLYLFEEGPPSIPDGFSRKELSYEESQKFIREIRITAFKEIYEKDGLESIFKMVNDLASPRQLARTAAHFNLSESEEVILLRSLNKDQTNKLTLFTQEYIFAKAIIADEIWINCAWETVKSFYSDPEILAYFFLSLPQKRLNWNLLNTSSSEISKIYWQKVNPYLYPIKLDDRLYALNKLQEVNRHVTVLNEITHFSEEVSSELLAETLLKAATIQSNENTEVESYGVGKIFETLHIRNDLEIQRLTKLEWIYLAFLTDLDSERKPKNLFNELAKNPDFFIEVVSIIYLPDEGREDEKYSEEELALRYKKADSARDLLESWREIPGVKKDGSIDKEKLTNWISTVRIKAKKHKRIYGVNSEIGKLLACYPRNHTSWPLDEICEIIDKLNNDDVVSQFESEIFNSRGVTVKTPYEGGIQERELAAYFDKMGKQILTKWPITATALLKLSKGYANDANREDERAHLDELR